MTEDVREEYKETQRERFNVARSAKAEQGYKGMRKSMTPTQKEYEERCGEISTFNYGAPLTKKELSAWDQAHQKEYLEYTIAKYDPNMKELGTMLGVDAGDVCRYLNKLGVTALHGRGRHKAIPEWKDFMDKRTHDTAEANSPDFFPAEEFTLAASDVVLSVEPAIIYDRGRLEVTGNPYDILTRQAEFCKTSLPKNCRIYISWEAVPDEA